MCKNSKHLKFCTCFVGPEEIVEEPKPRTISYEERVQKFHNHFKPPERPKISDEEYQKSEEAIKNGNYEETRLIWHLVRVNGSSGILGFIWPPNHSVREQITSDEIIELMNTQNIFDFDYTPEEDDVLTIREEYIYKQIGEEKRPRLINYLSVKFVGDKWEKGWHPVGVKSLDLGRGTLEITS